MTYTLIHHTGCGSSKKGLALLEEHGITPEVRKYMNKSERLSEEELRDIARKMGKVSPREFLRAKDAQKSGLADDASDDEVFAAMAAELGRATSGHKDPPPAVHAALEQSAQHKPAPPCL